MSRIEKLSIALTHEQVGALREAVEEGAFASTSEAVREAVSEWTDKRRKQREAELKRLRDLIAEGVASGIAPRRRTAAEISADGHRRLAEMKKRSHAR